MLPVQSETNRNPCALRARPTGRAFPPSASGGRSQAPTACAGLVVHFDASVDGVAEDYPPVRQNNQVGLRGNLLAAPPYDGELADIVELGVEPLHPPVPGVRDIDIAVRRNSDAHRFVEFTGARARLAERTEGLAIGGEPDDSLVAGVGDQQIAVDVDGDVARPEQLVSSGLSLPYGGERLPPLRDRLKVRRRTSGCGGSRCRPRIDVAVLVAVTFQGSLNVASLSPPGPRTANSFPSESNFWIRLFLLSATYRLPAASVPKPVGWRELHLYPCPSRR